MQFSILVLFGMESSTSPLLSFSNSGAMNRPILTTDDVRYKCIVCHLLITDPYQTECGHRGCKSCFKNIIDLAGEKPVSCPVLILYSFLINCLKI